MISSEPRRSRFELHFRLLGADIRVQLLFWISCALVGVIYYQDPHVRNELGGFAAFCLWMSVAVLSLLAHEIGHVLAARLLGVPIRIVLSGLGGRIFGLEELDELRRWRKLPILLAGSTLNLLLFGAAWSIPILPLPLDWRIAIAPALWLLMWVNAFWALLNVLPLWPLDGGRLTVEIGEAVLGQRGRTLALLLSLAVTFLLILFVIAWMRLTLINRFDARYTIHFIYFCILSLYCYAFWLSAFRALWGNTEPPDRTTESDRAA